MTPYVLKQQQKHKRENQAVGIWMKKNTIKRDP